MGKPRVSTKKTSLLYIEGYKKLTDVFTLVNHPDPAWTVRREQESGDPSDSP